MRRYRNPAGTSSARRGGALLIALALLALGVALLAGSAAQGRAADRSAKSLEATLLADAESRAALAAFVGGWNAGDDALTTGADLNATLGPRTSGVGGAPVTTRLRLHRLTATRFALAADCQVGPDDAVLARRRLILFLARPASPDSTAPRTTPAPIGRWSLSDLY